MHHIVCQLGLRPRPRVYSAYFVYLYILCNWPLPPAYYKNRSSAHGIDTVHDEKPNLLNTIPVYATDNSQAYTIDRPIEGAAEV